MPQNIIKLLKTKDKKKIPRTNQNMEKQHIPYERQIIWMIVDFFSETMGPERSFTAFLKCWMKNTVNLEIYTMKISFRNEEQNKTKHYQMKEN